VDHDPGPLEHPDRGHLRVRGGRRAQPQRDAPRPRRGPVVRLSARLPHTGDLPVTAGIPAMARAIEEAGFDGAWVSDHIVMPERIDSWYPFADDGVVRW